MWSCVRVRFILMFNLVSLLTAWFTGSLFSHVEFGTPDGTWIGAYPWKGIQERPRDYCKPYREYVYDIPCMPELAVQALVWMRSMIGTKYNFLDILGLWLQLRFLRNPHDKICSEFVGTGLLTWFGPARVLNVLVAWAYRLTPETLHLSPIFYGHIVKKVR